MSVHGLFGPRHLNSVYVKKSTNRTIAENVKHEIILKENYSMQKVFIGKKRKYKENNRV